MYMLFVCQGYDAAEPGLERVRWNTMAGDRDIVQEIAALIDENYRDAELERFEVVDPVLNEIVLSGTYSTDGRLDLERWRRPVDRTVGRIGESQLLQETDFNNVYRIRSDAQTREAGDVFIDAKTGREYLYGDEIIAERAGISRAQLAGLPPSFREAITRELSDNAVLFSAETKNESLVARKNGAGLQLVVTPDQAATMLNTLGPWGPWLVPGMDRRVCIDGKDTVRLSSIDEVRVLTAEELAELGYSRDAYEEFERYRESVLNFFEKGKDAPMMSTSFIEQMINDDLIGDLAFRKNMEEKGKESDYAESVYLQNVKTREYYRVFRQMNKSEKELEQKIKTGEAGDVSDELDNFRKAKNAIALRFLEHLTDERLAGSVDIAYRRKAAGAFVDKMDDPMSADEITVGIGKNETFVVAPAEIYALPGGGRTLYDVFADAQYFEFLKGVPDCSGMAEEQTAAIEHFYKAWDEMGHFAAIIPTDTLDVTQYAIVEEYGEFVSRQASEDKLNKINEEYMLRTLLAVSELEKQTGKKYDLESVKTALAAMFEHEGRCDVAADIGFDGDTADERAAVALRAFAERCTEKPFEKDRGSIEEYVTDMHRETGVWRVNGDLDAILEAARSADYGR